MSLHPVHRANRLRKALRAALEASEAACRPYAGEPYVVAIEVDVDLSVMTTAIIQAIDEIGNDQAISNKSPQ